MSEGTGDLARLLDAAERVRHLQREYFRHRTGLENCKAAERELDALIVELRAEPTLFDVNTEGGT